MGFANPARQGNPRTSATTRCSAPIAGPTCAPLIRGAKATTATLALAMLRQLAESTDSNSRVSREILARFFYPKGVGANPPTPLPGLFALAKKIFKKIFDKKSKL